MLTGWSELSLSSECVTAPIPHNFLPLVTNWVSYSAHCCEMLERFKILFYSTKDCWLLILLPSCFAFIHFNSVILGIFPIGIQLSLQLLAADSFGGLFARSYPFISPCVFSQRITLRLSVTTSDFGSHLLSLQCDWTLPHCWECEMKTAEEIESKEEKGCYSTSLHITGLQKILTLWLGNDLPSFAIAESVSLPFLCNFFQNSWVFFEAHVENCGQVTLGMWGGGGTKCGVTFLNIFMTWENSRKWCREKSDVWWVISKDLYIRPLSVSVALTLCVMSLSCGVVILSPHC